MMTAHELAAALKGRRTGTSWMARCPAHDDSEPSLSIRHSQTGKILVHCFAGCAQDDVIAALRAVGLWVSDQGRNGEASRRSAPAMVAEQVPHRGAMAMWTESAPPTGTVVERYLRSRAITVPLPRTLRFHPALRHRSGAESPAMVALVTSGVDDEPIAIHRTFLAHDGSRKAPLEPTKMMLGRCAGGAVRLAPADDTVMIGEGIETCLSAMQETGLPAWAALSTTGLRALDLPTRVREVIVLADGDEAGERAARAAAERWVRERRHVRIARPPAGYDFNDVLRRHGLDGEAF